MKKSVVILFTVILTMISCSKDDADPILSKDDADNTTLPTLSTLEITETTPTSAKSGGDITDTGGAEITAKGVCWSISPSPTILDFATDEGKNPSNYTSHLIGLTENTTYYVRAYATNSKGTSYGDELTFIARREFPGETIDITGSSFQMGTTGGRSNEQPTHNVTLSDFSISKYEVTNQQYVTFMNAVGANSDGSVGGTKYLYVGATDLPIYNISGQFVAKGGKETHPVVFVSWFGAKAYAEYYGGRLPTEAEWEFAARGGNSSNGYTYSGSNNIDDVAWYFTNSGDATHPIGTKSANELDLHDMSGNVWEWTNDWYKNDYYNSSPSNNPQGPSSGTSRVYRGGSCRYYASGCRVANRNSSTTTLTNSHLGFRPVFIP